QPPDDAAEWLAAAQGGSPEALGRLLEGCRKYLLGVANAELDPRLRAKAAASALGQEPFVEAHRIFGRFQGASPAELPLWLAAFRGAAPHELRLGLRAIRRNKLATFPRHYRDTAKRRADQEVAFAGSGAPPEPAAAVPTPSHVLMHGEELTALTAALAALPED